MKNVMFSKAMVVLAVAGLLAPQRVGFTAEPAHVAAASRNTSPIKDVELDKSGTLHGAAVDGQGHAIADVPVSLLRDGRIVSKAKSDANGRFAVSGLRGGVYQVTSNDASSVVRVWAAETAPPSAGKAVLLVPEQTVIRGQQKIRDVFKSNAFIVGSIIAAAVAIPIIVHNSRDDSQDDSSS